jgi:hypothetical protein
MLCVRECEQRKKRSLLCEMKYCGFVPREIRWHCGWTPFGSGMKLRVRKLW